MTHDHIRRTRAQVETLARVRKELGDIGPYRLAADIADVCGHWLGGQTYVRLENKPDRYLSLVLSRPGLIEAWSQVLGVPYPKDDHA